MKIRREDSRNEDEVGPAAGRRPDSDLRSPPFSFFPEDGTWGGRGKKEKRREPFPLFPKQRWGETPGGISGEKNKKNSTTAGGHNGCFGSRGTGDSAKGPKNAGLLPRFKDAAFVNRD